MSETEEEKSDEIEEGIPESGPSDFIPHPSRLDADRLLRGPRPCRGKDMNERARRLAWVLGNAAAAVGLPRNAMLDTHALDVVLKNALRFRLDPLSYQVCWLMRHPRK